MSQNKQNKTVWRGLAICKGKNFCAQTYVGCADCDYREELGCKDAVITIEFLSIKENTPVDGFDRGVASMNKEVAKTARNAGKLAKEMSTLTRNIRKVKSVKK